MFPDARSAEGVIPGRLAAFGFLARGIVYLLIGGIAAGAAILQRGRATGPGGALAKVLTGPGGRLVLWVVVAGLFAFVLFRVTQCLRTRRPLLLLGFVGSALGFTSAPVAARWGSTTWAPASSLTPGVASPSGSAARSPRSPEACRPSGR